MFSKIRKEINMSVIRREYSQFIQYIWTLCVGFGITLTSFGCDDSSSSASMSPQSTLNQCRDQNTTYSTARCLQPNRDPSYYIDQAHAYFDTLDLTADRDRIPNYHEQVSRWEWPPWLLLTGYTRDDMNLTADALRDVDPSTVPVRDCRFFDQQPFARCYVIFEYEGGLCPIYEEFIFNELGEMTWIEAWSDLPELLPQNETDRWAEDPNYPRLGTRIPGLGQSQGAFEWNSNEVLERVQGDEEVMDFIERASNWRQYWIETFTQAPLDFFATGCGWTTEKNEED